MDEAMKKQLEALAEQAKAEGWTREQLLDAVKAMGLQPESMQELDLEQMSQAGGGFDIMDVLGPVMQALGFTNVKPLRQVEKQLQSSGLARQHRQRKTLRDLKNDREGRR